MAKKIYAKTIAPKEISLEPRKLEAIERTDRLKSTSEFKTLAEQAARSTVFFKNYYVEELRETYKHFDRFKRVDKAFPYAKLGANEAPQLVLFDEPITEADLEVCLQKVAVMKRLGYKYAIIEKDSSLFDVFEQLGAI